MKCRIHFIDIFLREYEGKAKDMTKKTWRRITSLMLCAVMMLSMHTQAISLTIDDIELTPKASAVKSDAQVREVMDRIDAIGTVEYTDECLGKIVTAEKAYAALSSSQKLQVENYGKLLAARRGYDALAADKADTSGYTITDNGVINSTVRWYVYSNGVLEIAGTGSVPSYSSNAPWQSYVSSIKTIIVRSSITGIGASAFAGCNNVTSITLPFVGASRTATGWQAHFGYIFGYNSTHYTANTLYRPLANYYDTFAVSYTATPSTAFINGYYNNSFSNAWYTCQNYYYDTGKYYFYTYTYSVPAALKTVNITDAAKIEDGAFNFCQNITGVSLNDGITAIGRGAFQRCTALKDYVIPNSVTAIGEFAFNGDTALTEMYIPDGVTTVEPYSFCGCNQISRLSISSKAASIDKYAFYGCSALPKSVSRRSARSNASAVMPTAWKARKRWVSSTAPACISPAR